MILFLFCFPGRQTTYPVFFGEHVAGRCLVGVKGVLVLRLLGCLGYGFGCSGCFGVLRVFRMFGVMVHGRSLTFGRSSRLCSVLLISCKTTCHGSQGTVADPSHLQFVGHRRSPVEVQAGVFIVRCFPRRSHRGGAPQKSAR